MHIYITINVITLSVDARYEATIFEKIFFFQILHIPSYLKQKSDIEQFWLQKSSTHCNLCSLLEDFFFLAYPLLWAFCSVYSKFCCSNPPFFRLLSFSALFIHTSNVKQKPLLLLSWVPILVIHWGHLLFICFTCLFNGCYLAQDHLFWSSSFPKTGVEGNKNFRLLY